MMKYHHQFHVLLKFCILVTVAEAITLPGSRNNGRTYTVQSSNLLQENNNFRHLDPSDNSYDGPLIASTTNSTRSTSTAAGLNYGNDYQEMLEEHIGRNPGIVALGKEKGISEDGNVGDMTRVLDGLVVLGNLYDWLVRPGSGGAQVTVVIVDAIISPWFNVNEQRNEMSVTFSLVQNWTDKRIAYRWRLKHPEKFEYVTLTSYMNIEEIWLPDSTVLNEKRSFKHDGTPVRITPFGEVSREQRMSLTVNCPFYENEMFPFDSPKCSVDLTSFSWNASQIQYKWGEASSLENLVGLESNGFMLSSVQKLTKNVSCDSGVLKSSLVLEFQLERKLRSYIIKLYLPLGCFCLISIAGLIGSVGPEIGAGLSYFMFGLMSIFMAISFNGPDFNWGYKRTRLDSYYVLCVTTVILTGIINMFRLKRSSSSKSRNDSHELYEMHTDDDPGKNIQTNGSSSSSITPSTAAVAHNRTRLWRNSADNFSDDDDEEGGVQQIPSGVLYRCMKSIKRFIRRVFHLIHSCCLRINDFSVAIMLLVFISWNFYYWIRNLSKQD